MANRLPFAPTHRVVGVGDRGAVRRPGQQGPLPAWRPVHARIVRARRLPVHAAGRARGWGGNELGGKGLQEADLREGIREGGKILGWLVVARSDGPELEYAIYVRPSWTRGYRILRTWRDKEDRTFRSLDKLFKLPGTFNYHAPITVYPQGCAELRKFRGVLPRDGGVPGADGPDGAEAAAGTPVDHPHPAD